ncbi:hypothetical protein C7T35_34480 [Variovorax sp. WS11]|nr:hypothetical protein C7T35_34480 [Variovorax sp. WS11]
MPHPSPNKLLDLLRGRGARLAGPYRYLLEEFSLLEEHRKSADAHFRSEEEAIDKLYEAELAKLTPEQRQQFDMEHLADA